MNEELTLPQCLIDLSSIVELGRDLPRPANLDFDNMKIDLEPCQEAFEDSYVLCDDK